MAADVSYLSRIFNGGSVGVAKTTDPGEPIATRDFLGGNFSNSVLDCKQEKELDLDVHVPIGFEKRLDLESGKIYIQKRKSTKSSSSSKSEENKINDTVSTLQDLNLPTSDETKLELNLLPATTAAPSSVTPAVSSTTTAYSVCTLDKVKSALDRLEKNPNYMKRRSACTSLSPPSHSSSSVKDGGELMVEEEKSATGATYAGGCPRCLLYVLVSKKDPKCPRCNVTVPSPTGFKKPRIDLNISL